MTDTSDPFYSCILGVNKSHFLKCRFLSIGNQGSSAQSVQTQISAMQTHPDLGRLTPLKMTKYQEKEKRL